MLTMMGMKDNQERNQLEVVSLEDLVPKKSSGKKTGCSNGF